MKFTIDNIRPSEKNAKLHPYKQLQAIATSMGKFGFTQPIVVDKDGEIIAGHGRYFAYRQFRDSMELPEAWIVCAEDVAGRPLSEAEAEELRLLDNKLNESKWDKPVLLERLNFLQGSGIDMEDYGFNKALLLKLDMHVDRPEVEFTPELLEENNYVVLLFNNEIDWTTAKQVFGIRPVDALDSRKGYERRGMGRVIDGKKVVERIIQLEKHGGEAVS